MTRHLFRAIDDLFGLNNKDDIGNAAWSTKKVILGWAINTAKQVLTLPDDRKSSLLALLDTAPPIAIRC